MDRWPAVDPALRRRKLGELRRRQNIEASRWTPMERLARLDDLLSFSRALSARVPGGSSSDESLEQMRRAKARFKDADVRR